MSRPFRLPMTLGHIVTQTSSTRFVAHSLDFDLVEIGATEEEAWGNLMLAVKTYVEFGLSKGWDDYVIQPAPEQYKITEDMEVKMMPPLLIANAKRAVIAMRPHESKRAA